MGLFDFRRRSIHREQDQVWLTDAAREAGLLLAARSATTGTVVLFHFPSSLRRFRERLDAEQIAHRVLPEPLRPSQLATTAPPPLRVGVFDSYSPSAPDVWTGSPPPAAILNVVVAEHHLVPEPDDAILSFLAALPFPSTVGFHASLEDPGIAMFAGQLGPVLRRLGVENQTTAVHSSLLSKSIRRAQHSIRLTARSDVRADSAAEWLRLNCPEANTQGVDRNR